MFRVRKGETSDGLPFACFILVLSLSCLCHHATTTCCHLVLILSIFMTSFLLLLSSPLFRFLCVFFFILSLSLSFSLLSLQASGRAGDLQRSLAWLDRLREASEESPFCVGVLRSCICMRVGTGILISIYVDVGIHTYTYV